MNEAKKTGKGQDGQRKAGPSPAVIGIAVVVAAVAVYLYMNRGDEKGDDGDKTADGEGEVESTSLSDHLKGLGKTLAIGPAAVKVKAEGTEIVGQEAVSGLAGVLDGTDVNALISIIEKEKIEHVLVDPSITVRDPLPQATVRNRLALAHPAGRLNAEIMSKKLFIYGLGDGAPPLTDEAKRALVDIVRSEVGVQGAKAPTRLPPILEKEGDWDVVVTVRVVQGTHIAMFSRSGSTIAQAVTRAAGKIEGYYNSRNWDTRLGPLSEALASKVTVEVEVLYDQGTFIGPRDNIFLWRIIEPGIYGVRVNAGGKDRQIPPWYSVTTNLRTVTSILERAVKGMGGEDADYWKRDDVPIHRFRTVHFRERKPGGDLEDLYRASPRIPSTKDITREALVESLVGLNDWLADNANYSDGRMIYRYYPVRDEENNEYNMVRHALGAFSMALTQEFSPNPRYKEVAEQCMRFMEDRIRWGGKPRNGDGSLDEDADSWMGKPLPGPEVALFDCDENMYDRSKGPDWSNKMGAVAVAILGYTQYKRVGWELSGEREKILRGLADFVLYMQREDGSFNHYYVSKTNRYYNTRNSIYPGEILYSLARLYGDTKDERFRTAFKQSMKTNLDWFKEEMAQREPDGTYIERRRKDLVQFQPWIAMAMEEMHRYDPDPSYVDASNLVSTWVMDTYQYDDTRAFYPDKLGGYMKVLDELPAMHTFVYTEGTAASYVLARRAGSPSDVVQKLRRGALLAARFILQMQARVGENDYYYPNQKKAKGAVRYCMNHNKQRIDYTYHALSSVYRILHAATPEDYAYVQSIEMPERW